MSSVKSFQIVPDNTAETSGRSVKRIVPLNRIRLRIERVEGLNPYASFAKWGGGGTLGVSIIRAIVF